jgi:NNP family nitrate/nitrite transporter-like MFS transporter
VLVVLLAGVGACVALVGTMPPVPVAVALLFLGMALLGMGNGAVFQLVPQRFPERIGLVTGVVGAAGGLGGFLLPSALGVVRDATGSYAFGLVGCAVAFLGGMIVLLELGARWTHRWDDHAVQRAGVYSYRSSLAGLDDESPA